MSSRDGLRRHRDVNLNAGRTTICAPSVLPPSAAKQPTGMATHENWSQSFSELTSVVNDLTSHLQLSVHGHVVPLPSSRTVGVCLCALAVARILPALLSTLPHCTLSSYIVLIAIYAALEVGFFFYQWRRYDILRQTMHPPLTYATQHGPMSVTP